jgi:DNA-binding LacI/PurR family transcriptional regulator
MAKVSMREVAQASGVSKNAVSLALRGDMRISATTRARIEATARRLGYRKNPVVGELMARLRTESEHGYRATLALLNAHESRTALRQHPTIPTYVEGCRRRAAEQGYGLDEFWLRDPQLRPEGFSRILRARGIRGVVVVGLMNDNRLPTAFQPVWEQWPCVVTGVRTRTPALPFACADHHMLTLRAMENARRLGYRRPALVLDPVIDRLVDGRFTAGYFIAQQTLPRKDRVPSFHQVAEARHEPGVFARWLDKTKPDVLLTLYHEVRDWVEASGRSVPQDLGLIQLEWRKKHADWAGMNQHNDVAGEAAVDMLISMIHGGESGLPDFPRATLIGSTWMDGKTVRSPSRENGRTLSGSQLVGS